MRTLTRFAWFGLLVLGCASPRPRDPSAVHAECPVCKCEGDLACIDVVVGAATPHAEFDGRTYYFCSDDCRCAFEHDCKRYAQQH